MNFDAMFFATAISDAMATTVGMTIAIFLTMIYLIKKVIR